MNEECESINTEPVRENPVGFLAGQESVVNIDTLPANTSPCGRYDPRAILEAAGVKFLGEVKGDHLLRPVELPRGWKKVPTDHPEWSRLVDDQGRERAEIFHRHGADPDRHAASLELTRRFNCRLDREREEKGGVAVVIVTDCGKVKIHTTDPIKLPQAGSEGCKHACIQLAYGAAEAWLDTHYPDWENPGAYWD